MFHTMYHSYGYIEKTITEMIETLIIMIIVNRYNA